MLRRATLAAIVLGLSCATAAAMGPDLSNLNGNPTYERARTLIKAGAYGEAIPLLMQLKAEFKTSADVPNWLGFCHRKAQGLPASEGLLRRGLDLQSDPSRRERIPRRVVCRDRRPRQGPRAARLPHGSVRELRGSQGPRRGAREGAEDAVGRVARRRQTGSKGRSPPAGFSA